LCIHGRNEGVWTLTEPVAGETDARAALSILLIRDLILIDPASLVDAVVSVSSAYQEWGEYMKSRYGL
jgi:hypothetical protein